MTILLSTFTDWSQLHPYSIWYIEGVTDLMIILHTCGSYMLQSGLAKEYSMGKISFDNLDPLFDCFKDGLPSQIYNQGMFGSPTPLESRNPKE